MKKKVLLIATLLLTVCVTLTACKKQPAADPGAASAGTAAQTAADEHETETATATRATQPTTKGTTRAISDAAGEAVLQLPDENHGISVVSKTSPVQRGNSLNLVIMGKPGRSYQIECKLDGKESGITAAPLKAGEVGFATWDIPIPESAAAGVYDVTIKDADGTDYVITHIEVK